MKKIYINPKIKTVVLGGNEILAGSLEVDNTPKPGVSGDAKVMNHDYWEEE